MLSLITLLMEHYIQDFLFTVISKVIHKQKLVITDFIISNVTRI